MGAFSDGLASLWGKGVAATPGPPAMRLTLEPLRVHDPVSLSSDGTLNPNGVRFGSSEIYNVGACALPESPESLAPVTRSVPEGGGGACLPQSSPVTRLSAELTGERMISGASFPA